MHPVAIAQILALLAVANGTPVLARRLLHDRWAWPVDGGLRFVDGRPVLGMSKTIRGIVVALALTTVVAPLVGVTPIVGLWAAGAAMTGDLLSSFTKRRLGLPPSSRAAGLDQIPESLLPALACQGALGFGAGDIVTVTGIFLVGEIVLSRLLYRWRIRERPY
ncbi:MAG: CDP-archaeol synthase [Alphaproteobacteria bacterium]|nr:CDP-archaeol synthase [Alphaproteobacteria bacterium]